MARRSVLLAALLALGSPAASLAQPGQPAGEAQRGMAAYDKYCSQCHGAQGAADGPAAEFVYPRPRVFAGNSSYKFRSTASGELPTDADLFRVITEGIPGTSMPAFSRRLSDAERWDLVAVIKSFSPDFTDPDYTSTAVPMPELSGSQWPGSSEESVARGRELFVANGCVKCHGDSGRGSGESWPTLTDDWGDPIYPQDLTNPATFRNGSRPEDVYRTFSTGLNGTPMPAYADSIEPEARWDLVNYILSLYPPPESTEREAVLAARVEQVPVLGDAAWSEAPPTRYPLASNVIEPPRLYWPSIQFVDVRALYSDSEIGLLVEWNDRSRSEGASLEAAYADRDGAIHHQTDHPDQLAVQFPARNDDPRKRPYFMFGDNKRAVYLWWWRGHDDSVVERNAKGQGNFTDQAAGSQGVSHEMRWQDGRYSLLLRRALTTEDARNDVQFAPGAFVPMAFHAWDGSQGEVGDRRALTTWHWLYMEPPVERSRSLVQAGVAGLLTLGVLVLVVRRTRRSARA